MQLTDHLRILRRHWLLIAVIAAVGLMLAEGASLLATPQYSAKSVVYFSLPNGISGLDLQAGSTYAQDQVESYAELAATPVVLEPVINKYALAESSNALAGALSVTVVQGTVMISVVATDPSPAKAAVLANAVADSLNKQVTDFSPRNAAGKPSVSARVVTQAVTPMVPSSPKTKRNVAAGLLGGLLIGVVVAVLREVTDTRLLGADDVRQLTDAPIIGQISSKFSADEALRDNVYSPGMEGIRRVRTNLKFLGVEQRPLAVAITSAMPGEGKSTIAVSLAHALGESGQSVLLIDADLRRPAVGRITNLADGVGLTTVLIGAVELDDALQSWGASGVDVLTAGAVPPNPSELLESQAMERLMKEARSRYDVIVIDTAPLVPVVESAALSQMVSGYVLVARSGMVRSQDFAEALSTLENVDGRVYGVVLNDVPDRHDSYGYNSQDYGSTSTPSPPPNRRTLRGHKNVAHTEQHKRSRAKRVPVISGQPAARVTD